MEYRNVKFGELSAEEEIDKSPDLVTTGFYDFKGVVSKIVNGSEFLILGNKGSGKSIVGEHLKATSGIQPDGTYRFVAKFGMKDFPFKSFAKNNTGRRRSRNKTTNCLDVGTIGSSHPFIQI